MKRPDTYGKENGDEQRNSSGAFGEKSVLAGQTSVLRVEAFLPAIPDLEESPCRVARLEQSPVHLDFFVKSGQLNSDPTARCAMSRLFFADRMEMVEQAAIGADPDLYPYILRGVTEGLSYNALKMQHDIPCCRDVYYDSYRRFFWMLSKVRE